MKPVFFRDEDVRAIRARVEAGEKTWTEAVDRLLAAGEEALIQPVRSVRDNGGSPHFRVDGVYVPNKDGVMNAESNRRSSLLAQAAGQACMDLALCWLYTGEARYAEKALEQIHVWCVNRDTYMFPTGRVEDAWTPGAVYGGDVVMFLFMEKLLLSCHLLDGYDGWDLRAHAAVRQWIRKMVEPQRPTMFFAGEEMYNNWDDARCIYLLHGGLALDDLELTVEVFDRWAHTLAMKMTDEGQLPRETMRTRSMTYTLAALGHMIRIGEVAARLGVDLLGMAVNGRSARLAVDYAAHYLLHMDQWPFEMLNPVEKESFRQIGLFEIAYRRWGDSRYLEILDAYGGRAAAGRHAMLMYASATEA